MTLKGNKTYFFFFRLRILYFNQCFFHGHFHRLPMFTTVTGRLASTALNCHNFFIQYCTLTSHNWFQVLLQWEKPRIYLAVKVISKRRIFIPILRQFYNQLLQGIPEHWFIIKVSPSHPIPSPGQNIVFPKCHSLQNIVCDEEAPVFVLSLFFSVFVLKIF